MLYLINKKNLKIEKRINLIKKELNDFFDFKVTDPVIFFVNSRKQMDLIWGEKTADWMAGGTKNGMLFIFDPKKYLKETSHKDIKDFWKTLKHEYSHIYFRQINEGGVLPLWLNEGLACYLAEQNYSCEEKTKDDFLKIFFYFNKRDSDIYAISYFWVDLLIKEFGKDKLVKLVKSVKINPYLTPVRFGKIFQEIYGFKFNKKSFSELLL